MQNLIIDEITKAVWNQFTAKTHNEKRDYQYSVNDLRNVITEAYKNSEALQLQQTGVKQSVFYSIVDNGSLLEKFKERKTAEYALEDYKKMGFPDATILETVA